MFVPPPHFSFRKWGGDGLLIHHNIKNLRLLEKMSRNAKSNFPPCSVFQERGGLGWGIITHPVPRLRRDTSFHTNREGNFMCRRFPEIPANNILCGNSPLPFSYKGRGWGMGY